MMHTLLAGVDLSENGQAMDAIREVGPGNHFLGCAHTQANFESAFYRSPLADNNSFEQWQAEGSLDIAQRANTLWKRQLAEYVEPPLDPAVDEALLDLHQPAQGGGAGFKYLTATSGKGRAAPGELEHRGQRDVAGFTRNALQP
jgi:trimethylamine:corrinoid methyltransferase-like protein